ncbi:MAG: autotransporter outer membrane beta-barrel domain-containing protein [Pseudomonadales bacterium]|nr:autotransporter outer membrane beta-barrel domain-containing protein [Pseudomonadales bacterium]
MFTSKYPTLKTSLISFAGMLIALSVNFAHAEDVFKSICEAAEEEVLQNQVLTKTANRTLSPDELLQLCANADTATTTPEEVAAQFTSVKQQIAAQKGNIFKRFKALRAGDTGVSVAGLTYSIKGDEFSGEWLHAIADSIGGAAGEGAPVSKWGFFVNGSLTDGERDGSNLERGYENDASTATIGADYRFSRNIIGGIAYGINESSLEFDGNSDGMDNDMTNVIVYGTWYKEAFNVDVLIGATEGEIETTRQVTVSSVSNTIGGETDTQQTFISIASGYSFNNNALSYGPYASFDYITGEIDAYEESGTVGLEVSFDEQDIDSKVFTMGGQVSYAISTDWGVVAPHARVEWKKELDDDRDIITGQFSGIAGSTFSIEADDFDDNWFHAAVGVSAAFHHGLSAYIDYDSIIAYEDTSLTTLSYGGRWEASF